MAQRILFLLPYKSVRSLKSICHKHKEKMSSREGTRYSVEKIKKKFKKKKRKWVEDKTEKKNR